MKNDITAIIQARMGSSRLPGKMLKPIIDGKGSLELMIERVLLAEKIERLVIATTDSEIDDGIEDICGRLKISCFRGNEEDVLDRFYQAAVRHKSGVYVRLTGDCPLIDPSVIDRVCDFFMAGDYDYVNNFAEPTFPDGVDVEIFKFSALERAWKEAELPSQRGHVTPYIQDHPEIFRLGCMKDSADHSKMRWTLDQPEDLEFISNIYGALYHENKKFGTNDIVELLQEKPELNTINEQYVRHEAYYEQLLQEQGQRSQEGLNLHKCLEMQERAKKRIPGMTQLLSKRPDLFSMGVWPTYFHRAKGAEVWDLDGNRYIDMSIGGIGANVLGYADSEVDEAVEKAIRLGNSSSLNCPEEIELADLLIELHPWAEKVRYARTGGESMTIAVRIARAFTGKDKVAFCGYHGWHDWYLAANLETDNALGELLLPGLQPAGVPKALKGTAFPFHYNKLNELEKIVSENKNELAAIIIEPIRDNDPDEGFLEGVRRIADENGAVLIVDEISAGFRMNTGGAHLLLDFEPDIAVFSKALGNGYPIGAVIGKNDVMEAAQISFISSTYWTERTGPAAAIATIRKHQRMNVGKHLVDIGRKVQEGWKTAAEKHELDISVGGMPPMSHFSFNYDKSEVLRALYVQMMLEKGFLASSSFYAMYAHLDCHVNEYMEAVDEIFSRIVGAVKNNSAESMLKGRPAASGFKRLT